MRRLLCFLLVASVWGSAVTATPVAPITSCGADSLPQHSRFEGYLQPLCVGAPLLGATFLYRPHKEDFQSIRTHAGITSHLRWDDYTQFLPLAACYGLKIAGVEGRTQWGRMLVSHGVAAGAMMLVTRTMKAQIHSPRPGSSDNSSFPSGHTATAFMCAGFLHHEYGHLSPWISIGGYAVATATGIGRIVHNRHWVSDVLCGAGIGILTTELGYLASDLIFGNRYQRDVRQWKNFDRLHRPSFLALRVGLALPATRFADLGQNCLVPCSEASSALAVEGSTGSDVAVEGSTGCDVAVEGAYFFSPYLGVGTTVRLLSCNLLARDAQRDGTFSATNSDLWSQLVTANAYGSIPLHRMFRVQGKCGVGYAHSSVSHNSQRGAAVELSVEGQSSGTYALVAGVSFHATPSRRFDASIYADWNMMGATALSASRPFHFFTLGFASAIRF